MPCLSVSEKPSTRLSPGRVARHALKLMAVAALASCGGSNAPDAGAQVEEDRPSPFGSAPIDYGAGPGVAYDETQQDGRESALGQLQAQAISVPTGPGDAYLKGVFGAPFTWPIIPLHTILLADGRVLSYGTKPSGIQGGLLHYAVWDPSLGMGSKSKLLLSNTTGTDIFCAGQVLLPDTGNVLIVGGDRVVNGQRNYANNDVNVFTPVDNALTKQGQSMAYQRWYATLITTASGEQAVLGGRIDKFYEGDSQYPPTEDTYASTPEVYSPTSGWRTLTNATSDYAYGSKIQSWNYPRAWWSPDGRVVIFTVTGKIFSLDVAGTGALTQLPGTLPLGAFMLPAAMYQPGKILSVRDAGKAVVVDINGAAPVVTDAAPLSADRQYGNATILADGKVWVNGGSSTGNDLVGAVYDSELWDPATGGWTMTATAVKPRLYHSISMLMPDGTVLTGGGGAPGPVANLNAEIYFPPYLYKKDGSGLPATRPGIATAPTAGSWGQSIAVTMNNKNPVARMSLVRFGAVTHAFSNEQRFQDLSFTQKGTSLTVTLPDSAHNAPPGFYMLFALNADGVPSKAKVIRLGAS
ncbi:galactose oxidase-like domain-containing protein [Ideonella sp.]|uniref:galactose oxidase-like domain-containing protein n=1 Tax=Ideonella sp. TaxID=1929293 RepID=UPI002B4963BA|nr:galactose oxidase-like domain-containing protein [Ideonella sp.]HJV72459.1 galactose oxidase-like domain-containing protein [Ideonella sp.]